MINPRLLGCDLSRVSYAFSDGVNAQYPYANLKTYYADDKARSATVSNTMKSLTIDLGVSMPCNMMIIEGHNFADKSWSIYFSDDGVNYFAASLTDSFSYGGASVMFLSEVTKRYCRIAVSNASAFDYIEVGNIFLGNALEFDSPYEWDYVAGSKQFTTEKAIALDGRLRTSQSYGGRRRYAFTFKLQSDALAAKFDSFITLVRGDLRPFYLIDGSMIDYVHFENGESELRRYRYNNNNIAVNLQSQRT